MRAARGGRALIRSGHQYPIELARAAKVRYRAERERLAAEKAAVKTETDTAGALLKSTRDQ